MIVLFENDKASLLLAGVRRDAEGKIRNADVINGLWELEIKNGELLAKNSDGFVITRRSVPNWIEMEIPKNVKGDYNRVMCWAQEKYDEQNSIS